MPCGKARLTTSPNSTAKAISHMVGEHIFVGSTNLWVSRVEVFAALYGAFRHKVHWAQSMPCLCCLIHPFLDWNSIQLVWRDSIPNWVLDGFKFHVSTVSVWWTTGEGGASPIELACGVKTLVLSHHKLLLANDCSKIEQVYPDNMVNDNFYLQTLPFDSSNGSW